MGDRLCMNYKPKGDGIGVQEPRPSSRAKLREAPTSPAAMGGWEGGMVGGLDGGRVGWWEGGLVG